MSHRFHIFAPAKINLFLHITGRRGDGYHTLQSLMAFADVGDDLEFFPGEEFKLEITGPFADALTMPEDNLVYKAAQLLAREYQIPLSGKIKLTKNLPIASGIGGGSTDAAAALKGLIRLWGLPDDAPRLQKIAVRLGADVPACLYAQTVWAEGIGETLTPMPEMESLHLILVNPLVPVPTVEVFKKFKGPYSSLFPSPIEWGMHMSDLTAFKNDLTWAAIDTELIIENVLVAIANTNNCKLHRLSGSGATCFGIYETAEDAASAAKLLKEIHPTWWIAAAKTI